MRPVRPPANLSEDPLKQMKKTMNDFLEFIATQMGDKALNIHSDIKKYKETKGDLQNFDFPTLKYKPQPTQSNVCAKILHKKTKAFKCHDCIFQSNSIMCVNCFEESDHKGHIYEVIQVHGGCCDCGDEEKWNPKGFCKYHSNSNLVQELKRRVNKQEQKQFIHQLGFCFAYWFILYNEAQLCEIQGNLKSSQEYKSKMKDSNLFGNSLLEYLNQFNKNSLISNIMTYNLLNSKLQLKEFELVFCKKVTQKPIYEVILNMIKVSQLTAELTVFLFTHLFPLKQFRRELTITFFNLHHLNPQFAMSDFNHLSCQLLTSHKMMAQLAKTKQIQPLVYKPKKQQIHSFEELAQNFVRYYIDIDYLSSLYKDASSHYLNYHILSGQFPSLGYYKDLSYQFQETINYYGIEEIRFTRVIKILKVIKNSNQVMAVLQKGIQDLWIKFLSLYKTWNHDLFEDKTYETASIKNIYLTYQLTWAMTIFVYFEKLDEQEGLKLSYEDKISKLISVLQLDKDNSSIQKVKQTIQVLNSNIIFTGLTLGHPQTLDRFYTYFSFTFKKTFSTFSCSLYLYKVLVNILNQLNIKIKSQNSNNKQGYISDKFIFERPLKIVENMFNGQDFKDDDESIFDRKKNMIRLTYFMNLLIQASQTDVHQLMLAQMFEFSNQKYQKMLNKMYIQILKNYQKIALKDFKQIVDSFIANDSAFEKFISTSKQILIQHGKISIKSIHSNINNKQGEQKQSQMKIESQMNIFYYRSFKSKLPNINEKMVVFKVPSSNNNFLVDILSIQYVCRLLKILQSYVDIILLKGGKIQQRQTAILGFYVIQMIKIQKAFRYKSNYYYQIQNHNIQKAIKYQQISNKILKYFKSLQTYKLTLSIFTQDIIKIICSESQQHNHVINQSLQNINKQQQQKKLQRKKKIENKKQKIYAKFKSNQDKFQSTYANQLQKIKQQLADQQEINIENSLETIKSCIVCKQNNQKDTIKSDLMIMAFMQLSDLYQYFLKGKLPHNQNCHLVFKTCGHYIHKKCYTKINGNKQYTLCQLCKSPVNCIFPITSHLFEQKIVNSKQYQATQKQIYQDISFNYTSHLSMEQTIMQDCENSFGQILVDKRQFKQKLIQSIAIEIIFSAIVNKDSSFGFFQKRQFQIYQNILFGLKIFSKIQQRDLYKHKSAQQQTQMKAEKQKQKMNKTIQQRQLLSTKISSAQTPQKKNVLQITYFMQSYVKTLINNFISNQKQNPKQQKSILSAQCIQILNQTIQNLFGQQAKSIESLQNPKKMEMKNLEFNQCKQVKLLRSKVQFYHPPHQLQKLVELRGKCTNCLLYTNHIFICVICQWKGCKNCAKQSVYQHTAKQHSGNSIYIEADLGNIYLVTKKKYWVYQSIYKDYLGQSIKSYVSGMKLQKFTMSENRFNKDVKRSLLDFDIDSSIRYEEYNNKRQYSGSI